MKIAEWFIYFVRKCECYYYRNQYINIFIQRIYPACCRQWNIVLNGMHPIQPLNVVILFICLVVKYHDISINVYRTSNIDFNTLRPRRNGQHFADDIFKRIFYNKNIWISIKTSLKFVPKVRINNIPALVQIMAWRRPGDKPLSEPITVRVPTQICVTRPQWIKVDKWSPGLTA